MDDVYRSPEFESIHTLQRRLGTARKAEEHPYRPVLNGLGSLRCEPLRRRRRLVHRLQRQLPTREIHEPTAVLGRRCGMVSQLGG